MQIFHPFRAIKGGLRSGVTNTLEHICHRQTCTRAQELREELGLIETALAFPRRMQRDRDNEIKTPVAQARIVESLDQPLGHRMTQVNLRPVFEIVYDLAHHPAT